MQTPTQLKKPSNGRHHWRMLPVILLTLCGLWSPTVQAQVTLSNQAVTVDQGNGNNTYAKSSFDNSTLADQSPNSTTTPAFDINTGTLILNGGTLTTTETGAAVVNGAFIDYTLYDTNGDPVTASGGSGSIQLMQTSVSNGVRTFALSNNGLSVIPLSSSGSGSSISVIFRATYKNGGRTLPVRDDNGGAGYNAYYNVVGNRTPPPTVNPNTIQVAADGNSANSYYFPNTGTSPQFPGNNFVSSQNAGGTSGAFDINTGQLRLTNTTVTTTEAGNNTVSNVILYYRTRLAGTGGGAFQAITLAQSGSVSNGTRTFVIDPASTNNTNAQPNLIATPAVTATGNYVVDVYYQATGANSTSGNTFTITYPPTGYSSATFTVGGTPIATTIWTGAVNDNWFDPSNWSAGVPTSTTNALIRDLGAGNAVPYPNIYSDVVRTTASGAVLYDNSKSGPAKALNLTMGGSSQASRSILRLNVGQLQVFNNFDNSFDSFIQRENTIMEFAGTNQSITGGSFVRVDISGGGTKSLTGVMNIAESLNFLTPSVYTSTINPLANNPYTATNANAGVLQTDITQPANQLVNLSDQSTVNYNNGAQINGETDDSFLYGFIRTTRQGVGTNDTRAYGNIGLTLTFTGTNSPGNVEVTRNTVESYTPLQGAYSIRRIFGVRPSDQATNSGGLTATMTFHYRDAETKNLNGPNTITPGTGSIPEQNLTIFVSTNSGNSFALVGRDGPVDTNNNLVTYTGVKTFATFTLGDIDNPLPVVLAAFNAVRSNTSALLTWTTASELNNKGFNVQVSADGTTFRTLGFVASQNSNSSKALNYKYTDVEAGKAGTRYYRLEQVDIDGKTSYSPVRAVSFDGEQAAGVALVAYPNPFADAIGLTLQGTSTPDAMVQVKIVDMTGRTVRDQKVQMSGASLTLGDVSDLRAGLYLTKVTLPDGSVKTVRVQKQ